jgi:predicted DNA-binding transcriptional regulator YafY
MNRTDRLYALVEELRAVSPRPLSARRLAQRFEVSSRTIERDLSALQQSGVPIWAEPGRTGGYCLDASHTLAPLGFTVDEALAVSIALGMLSTSPFREPAVSALRKVVAVMDARSLRETAELAAHVHLLGDGAGRDGTASDGAAGDGTAGDGTAGDGAAAAPPEFARALRSGQVLRIVYRDRHGVETERDVEPLGYVGKGSDWYLIAWCRLRDGVRAFRGDRIAHAVATGERPPRREFRIQDLDIAYGELRTVSLT